MAQDHVDLVRIGLAGWNSGDLEAMLETFASDSEFDWSDSPGLQRGVYRGETAAKWLAEWRDMFDEIRIEPLEFIAVGDHVVVPNRAYLRGRDGVTVQATSAFVYTVHDGKVTRLRMYQDTDDALRAVRDC
jgi:ketosteroid isomerase-like protein